MNMLKSIWNKTFMRPNIYDGKPGWTMHIYISEDIICYLSLPPTKQDLTQGQWLEGRLIVGIKGGAGRARAEALVLQDYAGHWLT